MIAPLRQHWLHGFLDLCLLSLLAVERDYGAGLTERLAEAGFGELPGGTLYPSLVRLEQQGLVRAEREPSTSGPPRKYYELTDAGRATVVERVEAWRTFRGQIDGVADDAARRAAGTVS